MDKKDKETKKTIADELLEDNFFKPPMDDVIDDEVPEKHGVSDAGEEGPEKSDSSLLFDEFLKSPVEISPEETSELTIEERPVIPQTREAIPDIHPTVSASRSAAVLKTAGPSGSKMKLIIASLGGGAVLLLAVAGYFYLGHKSTDTTRSTAVTGSQTIVMTHETPPSGVQPPEVTRESAKPAPLPDGNHENNPTVKEQTPHQPGQQVAENVPPVQTSQPAQTIQEASKQFEVALEKIKTKAALDRVKRIGASIDKSLNFDIKENTANNTLYNLYVDKIYSSEGEATADNLKLMVANISNASVIKADGGYRILIGKYNSRGPADTDMKNIESAGLKGVIKEATSKVSTYNIRVFPFKSSKDAKEYISKVRKLAFKASFSEIK